MNREEIQVIKEMIGPHLKNKDFKTINIVEDPYGLENMGFKNCDGFFLEGYSELVAVRFLEFLDKNIEIEQRFYERKASTMNRFQARLGGIDLRDVVAQTYERDLVVLFQNGTETNEEDFSNQLMLHEFREDEFTAKHVDYSDSRTLISDYHESYDAFQRFVRSNFGLRELSEELSKWIRENKWVVIKIPRDKSFTIITEEGENGSKLKVFRSTHVIRLGGTEHTDIKVTQLTCDTAKVDKDRIVEEYKNKNIEFRGSHYILHPLGVSTRGNVKFLEPRRKQGD